MPSSVQGVLFDLGGVVIDWSPLHLYRKFFADKPEVTERFLREICPLEWNEIQDAGRSLENATRERVNQFPEWQEAIEAYYGRWEEMIAGPIRGTDGIILDLYESGVRLFALSNWSAETFPLIRDKFPVLKMFEKIFISGDYQCAKPDPAFFEAALEEIDVARNKLLFIDDNRRNVDAALGIGLPSIEFVDSIQLRSALVAIGILN